MIGYPEQILITRFQGRYFEPQPVINAVVTALSSNSTWEVSAAIILLTGRHPTEILKSAEFTQTGPYQLEFSGQLKSRSEKAIAYPIYLRLPIQAEASAQIFSLRSIRLVA